ncbi:MAG: ABC transporter ATP-binding protein [Turicibacter sp.]|nr:ABC transporter ATP-binding protein [Turicibacter sp.]MBQ1787277.1 ABC transporter ATP-binding protein [Turicibacter sp.]
MTKKEVVLSVRDLEIKFKVRHHYLNAIRRISLDLYQGETLAIVGESGSGKSVLIKSFTGMLESNGIITGGSIYFEGKDLTKKKKNKEWQGIRGGSIATVFQDPMTSLNPVRTIGSQITEVIIKHQKVSKKEAKEQAIDLMQRVGIKDARNRFEDYPHQYSGGMRQRIVIAIALACRPKILICDEPTTALDVTIQAQILKLIKELQSEYGFTTIYITHDLGVVANVADRVVVMYAGQIIEYGEVEEIFYEPAHPYTWALLLSLPQLGTKGDELYSIGGTPPSLYNQIIGDAFAPRNQYAMRIDFEEEPPFFEVTPTHYVKTWLRDSRAPKVEIPKPLQNLHQRLSSIYSIQGGGN